MMFNICDQKSFDNIVTWMESVKNNANVEIPIILVGNQIDKEYQIVIQKD